jgi:hypothetical protein
MLNAYINKWRPVIIATNYLARCRLKAECAKESSIHISLKSCLGILIQLFKVALAI